MFIGVTQYIYVIATISSYLMVIYKSNLLYGDFTNYFDQICHENNVNEKLHTLVIKDVNN